MYKIVIWGCGKRLSRYMNYFKGIIDSSYLLVDSSVNSFQNVKVEKPESIPLDENIRIVICVESEEVRKEIKEYAIASLHFDEDNFLSESEWVSYMLLNCDDVRLHPSVARIEASTLCQLKCPTCFMRIENYGGLKAGYLKYQDFKSFVDRNEYVKEIELANYGEVFLNPELGEIINYAAIKGVSLSIDGGVNLNDINDEVIDIMTTSGALKRITVAIDGASQEVYSKYRVKGSFEKVLDNIRKINKAKKEKGAEYPILSWQYILFDHNEDDVEAAIKYAKELDMSIFFKLDWGGEFIPKNAKKLKQLTGLEYFNRKEFNEKIGKTYLTEGVCRGMILRPVINYDGRLLGCCTVRNSDWGINVFKEGLENALNSNNYRRAVASLLSEELEPPKDTPCSMCKRVSNLKQFCIKLF